MHMHMATPFLLGGETGDDDTPNTRTPHPTPLLRRHVFHPTPPHPLAQASCFPPDPTHARTHLTPHFSSTSSRSSAPVMGAAGIRSLLSASTSRLDGLGSAGGEGGEGQRPRCAAVEKQLGMDRPRQQRRQQM